MYILIGIIGFIGICFLIILFINGASYNEDKSKEDEEQIKFVNEWCSKRRKK